MSGQGGEVWIESQQKRALEIALVTPLVPVAGGITVADRVSQNTYEVERSLFPGGMFMTRKFGDPSRDGFVHRWLRRTMMDELPQVMDVLSGQMALIGPRADTPDHIYDLFDAVASEDPNLHDERKEVRFRQKPGIISSYAVHSHRNNLEGVSESVRLSDEEALVANARLRAELDIADFHAASMEQDLRLVASTAAMAAANYGQYLARLFLPSSRPVEAEVALPETKPSE